MHKYRKLRKDLESLIQNMGCQKWEAFIHAPTKTYSIHTEADTRKGDVVNWAGFDTASCSDSMKKKNARYIALANPQNIEILLNYISDLENKQS